MSSDVFGHQPQQFSVPDSGWCPCHTSIPLRVLIATAVLFLTLYSAGFAQTIDTESVAAGLTMPPLGNTPQSDRPLLREIGDMHIFDPAAGNIEPLRSTITLATGTKADSLLPAKAVQDLVPATTVWEFVQQSRRLKIPDNERISGYQAQYRREALWISKILERATPFAGHIVDALDQRFLPVELALLPAIESGYQPDVHSAEYAAGIWQIVPLTANDIGIERSAWFDGRADIMVSTIAAIDYLSYLNAEFHGDWLLTLAAYNAGLGRVRSAIRRNASQGLATDFWSLRLPTETQNYVPKFLALVDMIRRGDAPQLVIPQVQRGDGFEIVELQSRVSLDKLARLTGISEFTLQRLNAALVHGVTPPSGPHRIYVRSGEGQRLRQILDDVDTANLYTLPATHLVASGDSVGSIALRYGLSERQLLSMNALDSSKILIGQELAVRSGGTLNDANIEYVVTIGDTLSDIADRFSVQLGDIRDAEGQQLVNDLIHPGVRLSIAIEEDRPG